jgi:hypothetical protein
MKNYQYNPLKSGFDMFYNLVLLIFILLSCHQNNLYILEKAII